MLQLLNALKPLVEAVLAPSPTADHQRAALVALDSIKNAIRRRDCRQGAAVLYLQCALATVACAVLRVHVSRTHSLCLNTRTGCFAPL